MQIKYKTKPLKFDPHKHISLASINLGLLKGNKIFLLKKKLFDL